MVADASLHRRSYSQRLVKPFEVVEQGYATGFVRLDGLRLRVNSTVNGAKNLKAL